MTRVRPIVLIPPRYCPYKSRSIARGEENEKNAEEIEKEREKERESEKRRNEKVCGGDVSVRRDRGSNMKWRLMLS